MNASTRALLLTTLAAAFVVAAPHPGSALPIVTTPSADLTGDDSVDASDFQCLVLLNIRMKSAGDLTSDHCQTDGDCADGDACRPAFGGFRLCLPGCLADRAVVGEARPTAVRRGRDELDL